MKPNQQEWLFIDNHSKTHRIILHHHTELGKLLIHYNYKELILYDEKVFKSSKYSFFIDEELCEIHVVRNGYRYSYHFFVNKETNTPLNQARKKLDYRDKKYMWLFVGVLAMVVSTLVYFSKFLSQRRDKEAQEQLYTNYGKWTTATIIEKRDFTKTIYSFQTNSQTLEDSLAYCYLPWEVGDTFSLHYISINPRMHRADTLHFNWITLQTFFEHTRQVHQRANINQDIIYINHLLATAYELHGIDGWKHIYYQTLPWVHTPYNKDSYLRMIRDDHFQQVLKAKQ